ncbi:hypothetical protein [Leucobacter massiliensis]|uniref:hypothetical protein n=1 Tax=Leucobacter massiliensis TaxID=1686285 RepID=UPI0011B213FD|nr:hypothetical protein [Leucobacter massiliensis]
MAYAAARLPELLERLEDLEQAHQQQAQVVAAERVRDAVIDMLEREPLPAQPVKDDYLVAVAPAYEGEYNDMQYRWDHSQWRSEFVATALRRDHVLREALSGGGPRTSYLPEQFARAWAPADLAVIHTLRGLVDSGDSGLRVVPLDRQEREQLETMLNAADPDVRVLDADDPVDGELFAGRASEAHDWMPAGVYEASGIDGEGEFRLVVGPVPGDDGATASAAFPAAEHDSTAMNQIAWILEHHTEHEPLTEVLHRVNEHVTATGRTGALPSDLGGVEHASRLERGVLLSDLLAEREQQLDSDRDGPEQSDPGRGVGRDL